MIESSLPGLDSRQIQKAVPCLIDKDILPRYLKQTFSVQYAVFKWTILVKSHGQSHDIGRGLNNSYLSFCAVNGRGCLFQRIANGWGRGPIVRPHIPGHHFMYSWQMDYQSLTLSFQRVHSASNYSRHLQKSHASTASFSARIHLQGKFSRLRPFHTSQGTESQATKIV